MRRYRLTRLQFTIDHGAVDADEVQVGLVEAGQDVALKQVARAAISIPLSQRPHEGHLCDHVKNTMQTKQLLLRIARVS